MESYNMTLSNQYGDNQRDLLYPAIFFNQFCFSCTNSQVNTVALKGSLDVLYLLLTLPLYGV